MIGEIPSAFRGRWSHINTDVRSITKSFVNHVQTSLALQVYSLGDWGAYQATALSVRDNLLVSVYRDGHILASQTIAIPDQLE